MQLRNKLLIVLLHSFRVSPPQNCSKIVSFINLLMGKCNQRSNFNQKVPIFTIQFLFINANKYKDFFSWKSDLFLKAIEVFSKDNLVFALELETFIM